MFWHCLKISHRFLSFMRKFQIIFFISVQIWVFGSSFLTTGLQFWIFVILCLLKIKPGLFNYFFCQRVLSLVCQYQVPTCLNVRDRIFLGIKIWIFRLKVCELLKNQTALELFCNFSHFFLSPFYKACANFKSLVHLIFKLGFLGPWDDISNVGKFLANVNLVCNVIKHE